MFGTVGFRSDRGWNLTELRVLAVVVLTIEFQLESESDSTILRFRSDRGQNLTGTGGAKLAYSGNSLCLLQQAQ